MDETIKFLINEDIEKYQAEVYKGLNKRQAKGVVIVLTIAILSFCLFHLLFMIPLFLSSWMSISLCMIAAFILFLRIEELDLLVFLSKKWEYKFHFGYCYDADLFNQFETNINKEEQQEEGKETPFYMKLFQKKQKKEVQSCLKKRIEEEILEPEMSIEEEPTYNDNMAEEITEDNHSDVSENHSTPTELPETKMDYEQEPDKYKEYIGSEDKKRYIQEAIPKQEVEWLFGDIEKEDVAMPVADKLSKPERCEADVIPKVENAKEIVTKADLGDTMLLDDNEGLTRFMLVEAKSGKKLFVSDGFRVGRRPDFADLVIRNNPTVSGKHAQISIKGDSFLIKDEDSRNGTYIDGIRIQPGFNVEVKPGSLITFSNEEFRLEKA